MGVDYSMMRGVMAVMLAAAAMGGGCAGDDGNGTPSVDASIDAAGGDIGALCTRMCNRIFAECQQMDVPATCVAECSADLEDCSAGELDAISDCGNVTCTGGDESPVTSCLANVGCIGGGGGGGGPSAARTHADDQRPASPRREPRAAVRRRG
jgi:hypothetical protein